VIALLRKVISPYALSQLTIESVLGFLEPSKLEMVARRVAVIQAERERLAHELSACRSIARVWRAQQTFYWWISSTPRAPPMP